jgi:hypothetical protein
LFFPAAHYEHSGRVLAIRDLSDGLVIAGKTGWTTISALRIG